MQSFATVRLLPALILLALTSACGGGGDTPTPPGGGGGGGGGGGSPPPAAPGNLTVAAAGLDRVTLRWQDNSADETAFELERTPSASSNWVRLQSLAANITSATDSSLSPSTEVRYRVRAVRGTEPSTYSGEVSARTQDEAVTLIAPATVVAEALSQTRVLVTWNDSSNDEDGFEVQRATGTDTSWTSTHIASANATIWTDSTLNANAVHRYRVRATLGEARSAFTLSDTVRTHQQSSDVIATLESVVTDVMPAANVSADNRNPIEELRALRNRLRDVPAVATTLLDTVTMTLQAITTEGLSIVFVNNRPPDEGWPTTSPAPAKLPAATAPATASPAVANAKKAVVTSFDGGEPLVAEVRAMLQTAGFEISGLGASVADMRNYRDLGALYIDTHGVSFYRVNSLKRDSTSRIIGWNLDMARTYFGLQTSTQADVTALSQYDSELTAGELLVSLAQGANGAWQAKMAITERFIQKYWSFKDGVAVIHACFAGAQPFSIGADCDGACDLTSPNTLNPTVVIDAIIAAGASMVMSFDHYTWSSFAAPTVRMFYDRMLGLNQTAAIAPGNRPFASGPVITQLRERGLDVFTKPNLTFFSVGFGGNEVNVTFHGNTTNAFLAPSVRNVDVVDDAKAATSRFELFGNFGTESGKVELDGVPLTLESWADNQIVATGPIVDPGFGELRVFPPDGVGSNKVPITEWQTTVTITNVFGIGSLRAVAELDLRFRADVHGYRTRVDGPVEKPDVMTTLAPQSTGSVLASGSEGDISFTGTEQMQWFARPAMLGGGEGPSNISAAGATLLLKPNTNQAQLCLLAYGYVTAVSGGQSIRQLAMFTGLVGFDSTRGLMGCLDLSLSQAFAMPGGSRVIFQEGNNVQRLSWTPLFPVSPPIGTTARE